MRRTLTIALSAVLVALGGCNVNDENPEAPDGVMSEDNVVYVDQGGSTNLLEQVKVYPEGMEATLSFRIIQQPEYAESGSTTWVSLGEVFTLEGATLKSADVRVPDEIPVDPVLMGAMQLKYQRAVIPGVLEVMVRVGEDILSVEEFNIVQTNRTPLPAPVITFKNPMPAVAGAPVADGDNWKYSLLLSGLDSGATVNFNGVDYLDVMPIDYSPSFLHLDPGAENSDYFREQGNAWRANGTSEGTGGYLVGFWAPPINQEPEEYAAAKVAAEATGNLRIYVDVETEAVPVGIVANTAAIGTTGTASFWRSNANGRQAATSFILVQLSNGTTRPYDGSIDTFTVMAGYFDQYLEGRTANFGATMNSKYNGCWSHVALRLAFTDLDTECPVGTPLMFFVMASDTMDGETVVVKRFLETPWTVQINTDRKAANPAV